MTPAGRFTVVARPGRQATRYVAIAAGSGITPVLSIVAALLEGEPGSTVTLVYANRTHRIGDVPRRGARPQGPVPRPVPARARALARGAGRRAALAAGSTASGCAGSSTTLVPPDDVDEWFLCGPQQMVDRPARDAARRRRADAPRVHTELFHVDPVPRAPGRRARGRAGGRGARDDPARRPRPPSSTCAPTTCGVLEAALRVRSDLPFACKGGVCGTCRARLVEGEVAMDVNYALEPEEIEKGYVLTCQSHPTSEQGRPRLRRLRRLRVACCSSPGCRCSRCRRR